MDDGSVPCPLCGAGAVPVAPVRERCFRHCPACDLVFVPVDQHPSVEKAAARYAKHNNDASNAGYVARLTRLVERLAVHAPTARRILDYGCGPAPVLVGLLRARGYDAVGYDPIFSPPLDHSARFDAILASEAFEHFALPGDEIRCIRGLLKPGGLLVLTTRFHAGPDTFADWWYARDLTHLSFYSRRTFDVIAARYGFERVESDGVELAVLRAHEKAPGRRPEAS